MGSLVITTTFRVTGFGHGTTHPGSSGVGLMVEEPAGLSFKLLVHDRHGPVTGLSFRLKQAKHGVFDATRTR
jgi:hypothetical protein